MSRKSLPVVLTEAERLRLEQWVRAGSTPQQIVLRARVILAAAAGQTDQQIALTLGIRRKTAALWRARAREQGHRRCLGDRAGARTQGALRRRPRGPVDRATLQSKPPGATHWSTRRLAHAQGVSKSTIQRAWQDHGLKPHRTKTFKLSRDPRFLEKLTDVVGVYLTPPQNAIVLCVDEKSQIRMALS